MKKYFFFLLWLVVAFTAQAQEGQIKFSEYDLSNGLHVILYPNGATPNVMVSLMYHVGSKNEDPARTGFAHLFEHLMFEGSENIGRGDYFGIVQAAGGSLNANTSQDRTYYFENMPSNELELALWLESERMYHAKIDTIGVNTQKGVVIEERKQSYDNQPYGTWLEELGKRVFKVHPYRWQTIGSPEHIRNSSFEDIHAFYQTYYVPNNAVLVIAGDFEEAQTKDWIAKYFESIPSGTLPLYRPNLVEPAQTELIRDTVYDNIQLPAIFMAYHAPAFGSKESYAMDILTRILSGGKSSKLKTNLDDKGLTVQSSLFYYASEDPGLVYGIAIANMGKEPTEVEDAISAEIEKITQDLVSEEEFQMALASVEYEAASQLQSLSGVAENLATYYTYTGDANRINQELSFYNEVTREEVLAVAQKYLQPNARVILHYLPKQANEQ
ncbi:MAG: putative zinc protease [Candidatus Ordinivivax streblomastigis]|jgi:predicted Zn-dependent peptidase|uniref:Putative zinc protease n=1 Tax=Candidatus Ordinivivax streblomastigis TaxID=2540710 RepID=A0A5M8P101_9BACT|nr:MAG: putative zinc protease [Candidatus Ordinivivax streblomastigis]MDR2843631.1 insulinase family protein [Candidatus Symbiothrix sp.]